MALISTALEHCSVRAEWQQNSADLDFGKHQAVSSLLEQLAALRMMGGEALSDTALLKDEALSAFFDWDAMAHPPTFGRRLAMMRWRRSAGLERIAIGLSERARPASGWRRSLRRWSASSGRRSRGPSSAACNPHKPGRDSHHPLLTVDVGAPAVVDGYLRPGSWGTGHGLEGFIRPSRPLWIKIKWDHPMRFVFYRAMAALQ